MAADVKSRSLKWGPASSRWWRHGCSTGRLGWLPADRGRPADGGDGGAGAGRQIRRSLPPYRQAQVWSRQGLDLDRSTLADWVGRAAWQLRPLREWLLARLKASPKLFAGPGPRSGRPPRRCSIPAAAGRRRDSCGLEPVLGPAESRTVGRRRPAMGRRRPAERRLCRRLCLCARPQGGAADRPPRQLQRHPAGRYGGSRTLAEKSGVALAFCRVGGVVAEPRPSQTRTSGFPAGGSSRSSFAQGAAPLMHDPGRWQGVPVEDPSHPVPGQLSGPAHRGMAQDYAYQAQSTRRIHPRSLPHVEIRPSCRLGRSAQVLCGETMDGQKAAAASAAVHSIRTALGWAIRSMFVAIGRN